MNREAPCKLLLCILPKGVAAGLLETLRKEKGILRASVKSARGVGRITPLAYRGIGAQSEKEVVSIVVPAATADELFDFVFERADIARPHGGILFMHELGPASAFALPEVPDEE